MALSDLLTPTTFADLPGWHGDDHGAAFEAFRRCARRAATRAYKTGSLGVEAHAFAPAFAAARNDRARSQAEARAFFETHFAPYTIDPPEGRSGLVTGYYEPEVEASPVKTRRFSHPLYARPPDLIDLDETNRPPEMDPSYAFGHRRPDGKIGPYPDRRAIETGALAGKGLEIAWLESRVDAFFIHVQGSARLCLTDGTEQRLTFAAKSGHPFTGPGSVLVAMGEIPAAEVSMQTIRDWLARHRDRADEILWQNRSFIFFRRAPVDEPGLGPVAAAKVPLAAGRSIAVDRMLHTFATPVFVKAPDVSGFGAAPFRRLMIAQDTGSAITGPARGDLFAGSGTAAGEIAGVIKAPAHFTLLVPKALAGRGGAQ